MLVTSRGPDILLTTATAASAAQLVDKAYGALATLVIYHPAGSTAGAAFIQVSNDYDVNNFPNPLVSEDPAATWLTLVPASLTTDTVIPVAGKAGVFTYLTSPVNGARAWRVKGGTSAAPGNFAGTTTLTSSLITDA